MAVRGQTPTLSPHGSGSLHGAGGGHGSPGYSLSERLLRGAKEEAARPEGRLHAAAHALHGSRTPQGSGPPSRSGTPLLESNLERGLHGLPIPHFPEVHHAMVVPELPMVTMKSHLLTLLCITAVILYWRGVWDTWDALFGLGLKSSLASTAFGLAIMIVLRISGVQLAESLPSA